jgi:hypothetical protein
MGQQHLSSLEERPCWVAFHYLLQQPEINKSKIKLQPTLALEIIIVYTNHP